MAEHDEQERSEQPTPKRQEEAKEQGQVAKSMELNSVAILIAAMLSFKVVSSFFGETIRRYFTTVYMESSLTTITVESAPQLLITFLQIFTITVGPVLLILLIFALAINYAQVGFIFAKKLLQPDFKKLNPLEGLKRMFSGRSLVELLKGILKVAIIGFISYIVINKYQDAYLALPNQSVSEIIGFIASLFFDLSIKLTIALLVFASADFGYQKWQHNKQLKMTKQEIKEEMKQQEGDPKIKSRIRSLQYQMVRRRMMQNVPEATVVVTNPTHIAIALKYEPKSRSDAPKVVAKGKEKIAEKIKAIAREHNIPIIEDKPLARSLFESCEIGMEIPAALYQAVAEILSQVYSNEKKRNLRGVNA
jgi:flagellar biosynthetic protein FlhB